MIRLAALLLSLSLLCGGVAVPPARAQQSPPPTEETRSDPGASRAKAPSSDTGAGPERAGTPAAAPDAAHPSGSAGAPADPGTGDEGTENGTTGPSPALPDQTEAAEPRSLDAHYRLGMEALKVRAEARAERHFREVLRIAPYHYLTHLALGRLYLARRPALARDHLETARRIHPSAEAVHYLLGQAYESLERYLEAAEAYRYAIYLNPRHYDANARLRGVLRKMRAGRSVLQRAADSFYRSPSVASLTLYGRIVMRHAEPREAVLEFEEVRRRQPDLPEAELWLARAYDAAGDPTASLDAYRRYLVARPEATGVRLLLVERLSAQGWYHDAATALEPLQTGAGADPQANGARLAPRERARVTFLRSRLLSAQRDPIAAAAERMRAHEQGYPQAPIDEAFGEDLALFPEQGGVWLAYGRWLEETGRPMEASDALAEAGTLDASLRAEAGERLRSLQAGGRAPVAASLALGQLAWADGQAQDALGYLEGVPAGHALDHRAALLRGLILRSQGEHERAMDAFMRYVFFFDDRRDVLYARGNLFWQLGRREEALALWRRNPDVLLRHPGLLLNVAEYQREQGDRDGEMDTRERLAQAVPANHANRIRLGDLLHAAGRISEAVLLWDRVLAERPRDADLLLRTGKGWLALGDRPRGLDLLRRASQLGALDMETTVLVAKELYDMQQFEEALSVYWQVYQEQPNHPDLPRVLPELALNLPVTAEQRQAAVDLARAGGRHAVATELLEGMLAEAPENARVRVSLAELYLMQDKVAQAEEVLLGAEPSPEDRLHGLELLSQAQERLGRHAALVKTLAQLQALRPDDRALMRRRGLLLAEQRRPAEARPLLEGAHQDDPADPAVRRSLADVLLAQGEADAAIGHLEALLALAPGETAARRRLIELLLRRQRWDAAAIHLEAWVAAHPKDAQARYNLVTAYLARFRKTEALPHYQALRAQGDRRSERLEPYFR